jgi:signal peptidase I
MNSSLIEARVTQSWLRELGLTHCFIYNGSSMVPTFRPGHLLYVRPDPSDISPGDVIVFDNSSGSNPTVHRVISIEERGLITRGDNNRIIDPIPVLLEHLIGRVEMLEDQGRILPVAGGRRGLWSARVGWGMRWIDRVLRRLFWKPYNTIRDCALIRKILHRWFSPYLKITHLNTPNGPLVKTTFKGRTVALWRPQQGHFECRKPYDLFVPRSDEVK